jgi:hypothetical protein
MKRKSGIIFADTIEELDLKSMGLYHDHCYHLYRGKTSEICDEYKYKHLMIEEKEYCFIYEEDIPYIPEENE